MDELLKDFLTESAEQLEAIGAQLVRFEQDPSDARIIANIFRLIHALKGTCGFLNLPRLEKIAHCAEALIDRLRDGATPDGDIVALVLATVDRINLILAALGEGRGEPSGDDGPLIADLQRAAEQARAPKRLLAPPVSAGGPDFGPGPTPPERRIDTVRISVKTLERLASLVSELVLTRNQLIDVARAVSAERMLTPLQRLSAVTADLQAGVLAARMLPIERLFGNFHRLVRDLATDLGKKAELVLRGGGAELDRQLIEAIRDPLTHLIRNAVDHGIEPPEERLRLGKPDVGLIEVSASHRAGIVSIEVADDGRGLDAEAIRTRALALGLGSREELAARSEAELLPLVFAPGFTTAQMSRISGRGVGLDIVRANIEGIGGSVSLTSRSGRGATIVLRIPLTLAILPAFIVTAGGERFALPQHFVEEILEPEGEDSALIDLQGAQVLNIAEGPLPVATLSQLARNRTQPPARRAGQGLILKMRSGVHGFALIVDEIIDLQEIVLKPLPAPLHPTTLFSAAAILGDGSVVLVLDAAGISAALGLPKSSAPRIAAPAETKAASARAKVVIFRSGGATLRALPVSAIRKIQPLAPDRVEIVDGACVIRVDGRLVALLQRDRSRATELARKSPTALILEFGEERVALVVDEIVDVAEEEIRFELPGHGRGVLGVAILRGEPTEILDPGYFFEPRLPVPEPRAARAAGPSVLLVEPAGFFRTLITDALVRSGFVVSAFSDDAEALTAIGRATPVAAVLVDIDLAAVRHGAFAREIRASATDFPVLIGLAAHAGPANQARARRAGLSSAVGKFDRARLISAIRSAGAGEVTEIAA